MLSVEVTGADEVGTRLAALPDAMTAALAAASNALAGQLVELVRAKLGGGVLQSRSGALARSVSVSGPTIVGGKVVTSIAAGGDVKYAAIQEYGGATSPHDILPSRGKALAFIAGGREVFAKVVHHPGSHIPERSYLRASLAEMAPAIEQGMSAAALAAVAGAMGR
jgi:phage gpG-like protein